ncbi:MAG: type II secretion system F family protein [Ilumatobacteraceae bacterium]
MSLLIALLLGAGAGSGALLVVRSMRGHQLASAVVRLRSGGGPQSVTAASPWGHACGWIAQRTSATLAANLALVDRDPIAHAVLRLRNAVLALVVVPLCVAGASVVGSPVHPGVAVVLGLSLTCVGLLAPNYVVATRAARRRSDAVAALSSYLDLVTVLLAGGSGLETALHGAASTGDGWMFTQIRELLLRARTTRTSIWDEFATLGERVAIPQLVELGASVQLAGRQGARVADSLAARAQALRTKVLAGIEADAAAATERMGLPTVLLFAGFLFLLGYPATQIILATT